MQADLLSGWHYCDWTDGGVSPHMSKDIGGKLMRIGPFLLLIMTVLLLSAATVWMAQASGLLALLPAVGTVLLILTILIRRAH